MKFVENTVGDKEIRFANPHYAVVIPQTCPDGRLHELLGLYGFKDEAMRAAENATSANPASKAMVVPVDVALAPRT